MANQPSYHSPDHPSEFFADGQANRPRRIEPGDAALQLGSADASFRAIVLRPVSDHFPGGCLPVRGKGTLVLNVPFARGVQATTSGTPATRAGMTVISIDDEANAAFDKVIAAETLEHVPDDQRMMDEVARVLRPGGLAAVTVPCLVMGFADDADPLAARAREVAAAIPASEYLELPSTGHLTPVTNPELVIGPVLDFYRRTDTRN